MELVFEVPFAFLAAAGFAVLFYAPKKCLMASGSIGALGWIVNHSLGMIDIPMILAVFIAAIIVAAASEWMARYYKTPVTVFAVPGIVPLVPGSLAYSTIYSLAEGNYYDGVTLGSKTFLVAGSIAAGLVFVGALARTIKYRSGHHVAESVVDHKK